MGVIAIYIYIQEAIFCEIFYIYKIAEKRYHFYVERLVFQAEIPRALLSNKNGIFIFEKSNCSIAIKLYVNFLNHCNQQLLFFVHDTIQWLNCVVHYLNMKMKGKLVEIIDLQLCG